MRPLIEIFVIALVIYIGWNQPFKDHAAAVVPSLAGKGRSVETGRATPTPSRYEVPPQVPARSNAWMWEEKTMDRARPANARVDSR